MEDVLAANAIETHVNGMFPRQLHPKEREFLEFVLPMERRGYKVYRDLLDAMVVLGPGRRGNGNLVLGYRGDIPDTQSPLASVVAFGAVESQHNTFTITVREFIGKQIDIEIASSIDDEVFHQSDEKRRWTYSQWSPGKLSPATGAAVREISIGDTATLVVAPTEKRIWVHEGTSGMVYLIPITNFYNELMLHKNIRDPKIALQSNKFFENAGVYSDEDLRFAFIAYNKLRPKVTIQNLTTPNVEQTGMLTALKRFFTR